MKRSILSFLAAATLTAAPVLIATQVLAADGPDAARDEVRALGKAWSGKVAQASYGIYGPLLKAQKTGDAKVTRDRSYGSHARHRLDVFAPPEADGAPVLVYIHGGGLTVGDKRSGAVDGAAYDNVGFWAVRNGLVGVTMNYRLVPDAAFPSGGEDVAAAVAWLRDNVAQYGGDPNGIYLVGHSAGGTVLGEYLYHPKVRPEGGPQIAGAIFLSGATGSYGVRPKTAAAYYGQDKAAWESNSVNALLRRYEGPLVPTFLVTAELDPAGIENWSLEHLRILCDKLGGCPRFTQVPGHNHITTALSVNTGDDAFAAPLLRFVRRAAAAEVWVPKK